MNTTCFDLKKINTLTKYPSIPTYHQMADRGMLADVPLEIPEGPLYLSEKIDGTNARIIEFVNPDERDWPKERAWLIGSREELLHAKGDLIPSNDQGIVEALEATAESLSVLLKTHAPGIVVYYGEVYGSKIGAACKNYTQKGSSGFRLFDVAAYSYEVFAKILEMPIEKIASWREQNLQPWLPTKFISTAPGCPPIMRVPTWQIEAPDSTMPKTPQATLKWLAQFPTDTKCALDGQPGMAEGYVLRNENRSFIAKLRFEDYTRTLTKRLA